MTMNLPVSWMLVVCSNPENRGHFYSQQVSLSIEENMKKAGFDAMYKLEGAGDIGT